MKKQEMFHNRFAVMLKCMEENNYVDCNRCGEEAFYLTHGKYNISNEGG